MSMTQVAFLRKADITTKSNLEECIRGLGYDFKFLDDFVNLLEQDGCSCTINGHQAFFEVNVDDPAGITEDCDWIKPDLSNQDTAISFVWGADFAAGACIGLISVALIDKCNALIYYLDDEMKYSREMLLNDTPEYLAELEKQPKTLRKYPASPTEESKKTEKKKSFWDKIRDMF